MSDPNVLTIGHSNHPIETFLSLLKVHKVEGLIDVRTKPFSRYQPQFNRVNLANAVIAEDVHYFYAGKVLGGMSDLSITDPVFVKKMERVVELSKEGRVALMCAEKDPKTCHRAMKLTAWLHVNFPEIECAHIIPGEPLVDSRAFQAKQKKTWGWFELFPHGTYGNKKNQLELDLAPVASQ